jgi:hypothetical protein
MRISNWDSLNVGDGGIEAMIDDYEVCVCGDIDKLVGIKKGRTKKDGSRVQCFFLILLTP